MKDSTSKPIKAFSSEDSVVMVCGDPDFTGCYEVIYWAISAGCSIEGIAAVDDHDFLCCGRSGNKEDRWTATSTPGLTSAMRPSPCAVASRTALTSS